MRSGSSGHGNATTTTVQQHSETENNVTSNRFGDEGNAITLLNDCRDAMKAILDKYEATIIEDRKRPRTVATLSGLANAQQHVPESRVTPKVARRNEGNVMITLFDEDSRHADIIGDEEVTLFAESTHLKRDDDDEDDDTDDDDDIIDLQGVEEVASPQAFRQRGGKKPRYFVDMTEPDHVVDITAALTDEAAHLQTSNKSPMDRITEIFPDIDSDYVFRLLSTAGMSPVRIFTCNKTDDCTQVESAIQATLSIIVENGPSSYPKRKDIDLPAPPLPEEQEATIVKIQDYYSPSVEYDFKNEEYQSQCLSKIAHTFPFLKMEGAIRHLARANGRYAICHQYICNAIMGRTIGAAAAASEDLEERELDALERALLGGRLSHAQKDSLSLPTLSQCKLLAAKKGDATEITKTTPTTLSFPSKTRQKQQPVVVTNTVLLDEIAFVVAHQLEWKEAVQTRRKRQLARAVSQVNGTSVECQCCYADCDFEEEIVYCQKEGHLFCMDCLKLYAEERIFGLGNFGKNATELMCMNHDGCGSGFDITHLQKALPQKVMAQYEELQARLTLEQAGVQDLCKCSKCGFQAQLCPTQMIFECPIPSCLYKSCRKCGKDVHIPLRCDEVETEKLATSGRQTVEEAMTDALLRTCPKPTCGKKFYKSDGCNRMTCACGTSSCYICRQEILPTIGYAHFCQLPLCTHTNCTRCRLYSDNKEDERMALREAGLKAAAIVEIDNGVNVNVDALLKDPKQTVTL